MTRKRYVQFGRFVNQSSAINPGGVAEILNQDR